MASIQVSLSSDLVAWKMNFSQRDFWAPLSSCLPCQVGPHLFCPSARKSVAKMRRKKREEVPDSYRFIYVCVWNECFNYVYLTLLNRRFLIYPVNFCTYNLITRHLHQQQRVEDNRSVSFPSFLSSSFLSGLCWKLQISLKFKVSCLIPLFLLPTQLFKEMQSLCYDSLSWLGTS